MLKSWAVSKGVSEQPWAGPLSRQVDDHSLAFGDSGGEIPKGQYGVGTI
ncbi:MAG: DNA polymerase ligase N-terminal domain-containing protein [Isosphaeraceae bacterium]